MTMKRYLFYLLPLILFFYTGCGKEREALKSNQIKVTPISLFSKEFKDMERAFFKYSTTVKYEYTGTKKNLMLGWEVWQNGKIKEKFDGLTLYPVSPKGVCSVCLNDFPPETQKTGYELFLAVAGLDPQMKNTGSTKGSILKPELDPDSPDIITWGKPEEPFVKPDKEEPVIGKLCMGKGAGLLKGSEDFADTVKRVEWVVVIKFKFVDKVRY